MGARIRVGKVGSGRDSRSGGCGVEPLQVFIISHKMDIGAMIIDQNCIF